MSATLNLLTPREMALAKWIAELVEGTFPDDRQQLVALCTTSMVLAAADKDGLPVDTDSAVIRRFGLTIKQGCEARKGKRSEAAVAAMAVALATLRKAQGMKVEV